MKLSGRRKVTWFKRFYEHLRCLTPREGVRGRDALRHRREIVVEAPQMSTLDSQVSLSCHGARKLTHALLEAESLEGSHLGGCICHWLQHLQRQQ